MSQEPNKPIAEATSASPVNAWLEQADEYARRKPIKAVLTAFGAGFLVNLLPIGAIVGALASIVLMMARPVLLFLGILKACELWKPRSS